MSFRFQFRRGTTAERDASNPILAAGEPAVVLDSGQPAELVLGDGVTAMADLRSAVWDDDARLTDDRAPTAHTHPLADVTDAGTAAAADVGDFATPAELTAGLAEVAPLPHRFTVLDDMLWPSRYEAAGSSLAGAVPGNVYVKMFQATDDVVVSGMSMVSGNAAGSGQTMTRFCLYHVGDLNPGGLVDGKRASFMPIARTDSDTTIFTVIDTLYTKAWSASGGWPASVRLRRGEWYAAGYMLLGGTSPKIVGVAAYPRPQMSNLGMAFSGNPGGMGTCTDLWPYWLGASFNYDGGPATAWMGLTVDPVSTIAAPRTAVALGDSLVTSGGGWIGFGNAQSGSKLVLLNNAGVGGQQIHQMTPRVGTDVAPYEPEVVILHGGVNDIAGGASTDTVKTRYLECLAALEAIPSVVDIVLCTPPPSSSITGGEITVLSEVRAWLLALNRPGVTVADTGMAMSTGDGITRDAAKSPDGVHPNLLGLQAMGDAVDGVLAAL